MRIGPRRMLLLIVFAVMGLLAAMAGVAVYGPVSTTPKEHPAGATAPISANVSTIEQLHDAGITGEDVTVGIVDITGFDTNHPALVGHVVAARAFAAGETIRNGGRTDHGTAAASIVANTAPDSRLYLASFDTVDGFRDAVAWMIQENVDVIVTPVTFYGKFNSQNATVSEITRRATERGIVVVASVGNLGRGHWEGQYRPVGDGVHRFAGGTRNYLQSANRASLRLWLSWNRSRRSEDYTVELYRTDGTTSRLVARSQPYRADEIPNERIVARLENGTYYIRVTGPPNATGAQLKLESPTHTFQFRSRSGSITAPATVPEVIAVGAYNRDTGRVRPFSSAGPTRDDRIGVDVVAPDGYPAATKPAGFVGSSASAPYVAGVVALVLDAGGERSPRAVERLLEESAMDLRKSGPDTVSGYGLVRPAEAVRLV